MSARDSILGSLLIASYDHHGLMLDLYGELDEDGYTVHHACIRHTLISMPDAVSADLIDVLSAYCDDVLPSAEELLKESQYEMRIEAIQRDREMAYS